MFVIVCNICGFSSLCEVLCGHGGFQATAALPQFALVAVESHLLQGGGGGQWGDVWACGGPWVAGAVVDEL